MGETLSLLLGKVHFLGPHSWTALMLPVQLELRRGPFCVVGALSKEGLVTDVAMTSQGQVRINIYNSTAEVYTLSAKLAVVQVFGVRDLIVSRIGEGEKQEEPRGLRGVKRPLKERGDAKVTGGARTGTATAKDPAEDPGLHVREVEDAGQGGRLLAGGPGPQVRELEVVVLEARCGLEGQGRDGKQEKGGVTGDTEGVHPVKSKITEVSVGNVGPNLGVGGGVWGVELQTAVSGELPGVLTTEAGRPAEVDSKWLQRAPLGEDLEKAVGGQGSHGQSMEQLGSKLQEEMLRDFPGLAGGPAGGVNNKARSLEVQGVELLVDVPKCRGKKTPIGVERTADKGQVEAQLMEYLALGYLEEVGLGTDCYLSPLLPLRKPSGRYRFTNDFRELNAFYKGRLAGCTGQIDVKRVVRNIPLSTSLFCSLDISDAFFQVPLAVACQWLMGFSWYHRRFVWKVIPQGFFLSSIWFGERIAEILGKVPGVVTYADDILICGEDFRRLHKRVRSVCSILGEFGFTISSSKCTWCTASVSFLGYTISKDRWSLEGYLKEKRSCFPSIRCYKSLQRVIGVLSYCRNMVPRLEEHLKGLRDKLAACKYRRQGEDWWSAVEGESLRLVDRLLAGRLNLLLPGGNPIQFTLETDWSGEYAAYILFADVEEDSGGVQVKKTRRLVDMGSRVVNNCTSSFLGELKAVKWACSSTRHYRGDVPTVLHVDNEAVVHALGHRPWVDSDIRVMRVLAWLGDNEPGILPRYLPGSKNVGADLLSRPVGHPSVQDLMQPLRYRDTGEEDKCLQVGVRTGRAVGLVEMERVWENDIHLGHPGIELTWQNAKERGLQVSKAEVRDRVKKCRACMSFGRAQKTRMKHLPVEVTAPGSLLVCDVLGPLPRSREGLQYVLVVVDALTRVSEHYPMLGCCSSEVIEKLSIWVEGRGMATHILFDNAPYFTSNEMSRWAANLSIGLWFTVPYRHSSLGLAERAIGTLLGRIRRMTMGLSPTRWPECLQVATQVINTWHHKGINMIPNTAWGGGPEVWGRLREQELNRLEQRNSREGRKEPPEYAVGQTVWVHYKAWADNPEKLGAQWRGPCQLVQSLSSSRWEVLMEEGTRLVAHVESLRAYLAGSL